MSRKVTVTRTMLGRLVSVKADVSIDTATKVLEALDDVVMGQMQSGLRVRLFGAGSLEVKKTKQTRRPNPNVKGAVVDVPAGEKIVFRAVRI